MQHAMSDVPPFDRGEPTIAVFVCKRCGDGVVASPSGPTEAERKHTCKPRPCYADELEDAMFQALIHMPDNVRQQ